ncbi:hypothetical protein DOTSEDRAFT_174354 [Dothistroma septosporum NZE10]|uniref:RNase MRP protein 1 RNA binding domain-containing protein n=1 Tax=Dothistroma septosporum (strain NZE10 / CBS 128990) TaxID=675120 RepID=M2Y5H6_DOTSN|nr:hypothetical protein DOTSEDRAFT_174354 [Dothistroma septosporum NZE10]
MVAEDLVQVLLPDQAELQHLADILHLFHHRNKNQHRRSIWWRHFSVFRKQLSSLVTDLGHLNEAASTNLALTKKKARDARINLTTTKRVNFWQDIMAAKWQHAFSQLVADGRFSVLGLFLLAALSQVCQIVGITAELEDLGQAEVEKVLEEFGKEAWESDERSHQHAGEEDLGELVQRDGEAASSGTEAINSLRQTVPSEQVVNSSPKGPKSTKKRTATMSDGSYKKKRKRGNAIDDIFG